MTEAYTTLENTIKYYEYGTQIPFNFQFMESSKYNSTSFDFIKSIMGFIDHLPKEERVHANWVVR